MTEACAPGKVILFGEHSVVYGRPAIAVPVTEVKATVLVEDGRPAPGVTIRATDLGCTIDVANAAPDEPLSVTIRNTLALAGVGLESVRLAVTIRSTIPVASGLGSGAAVATALARAVGAHLGFPLSDDAVSTIAYEAEKIYHGTPSGIDNTVVAFERPVYFCRGHPIVTFDVRQPFWLAIADTGVPSLTRASVADVRAAWQYEPGRYEAIFDRIGALVRQARHAIECGETGQLGELMDENQRWLRELDVSSPELEALVEAAHCGGAAGAKLSGGGRGGNAIALVEPGNAESVRQALVVAGARRVIVTEVR